MKYKANIHYKDRCVTITTTQKKNEGDWELKNFLAAMRLTSGIDFRTLYYKSDISEENILKIENGEVDITEENLNALQKTFKFPKKIIRLGDNPDRPILAIRLIEMREKNKYTQSQLSKILGIAQTTYAGYETGKSEPDIKTLIKIADQYKVSIDYLVGRYQ